MALYERRMSVCSYFGPLVRSALTTRLPFLQSDAEPFQHCSQIQRAPVHRTQPPGLPPCKYPAVPRRLRTGLPARQRPILRPPARPSADRTFFPGARDPDVSCAGARPSASGRLKTAVPTVLGSSVPAVLAADFPSSNATPGQPSSFPEARDTRGTRCDVQVGHWAVFQNDPLEHPRWSCKARQKSAS